MKEVVSVLYNMVCMYVLYTVAKYISYSHNVQCIVYHIMFGSNKKIEYFAQFIHVRTYNHNVYKVQRLFVYTQGASNM